MSTQITSPAAFQTARLFGVDYAVVDYESASNEILKNARSHMSYGVSALAVHGLMTAKTQPGFQEKLKKIPMIVPDGQPVRWALNRFYSLGMKDRVYGPRLTEEVLKKANQENLAVFLFGSTEETLNRLCSVIRERFPNIILAGIHPDRFRDATPEEDEADVKKINESGAHLVLVGRGCPQQEVWVSDHIQRINAAMMAVGAAFDFLAGNTRQAPKWMQNAGLEWFFRLCMEPRRLFRRYLVTNSLFLYHYFKHRFIYRKPTE